MLGFEGLFFLIKIFPSDFPRKKLSCTCLLESVVFILFGGRKSTKKTWVPAAFFFSFAYLKTVLHVVQGTPQKDLVKV